MRFFVIISVLMLGTSPVFAEETFAFFKPGVMRTQQTDCQKRYRVWLRTFGNWTQSEATTADELNLASYGLTLGVDRQFGKNWLFGLALGENKTTVKFTQSAYKDDIDAFHVDVFARRTFDHFFVDVEGNVGYNTHSSTVQRNASQWGINGEAGAWWNHGLGRVEPYVRFSHVYRDGNGSDTKETLIGGFRYSWRTATDLTTTVPRLYGGVIQELGKQSLFSVTSFGNTSTVFPVGNVEVPATRLFLGGGFTTTMGTSLDVSLRYTAEVSSRYTSHTALLGFNCNF